MIPSENFSLRRILFKNTSIHLGSQVLSVLVGVATTFVLSRYLGVERFGGLNYVLAFYYFFLTLADLGIGTIVIRECSQKPEEAGKIIGTMGSFKFLWSIFLIVTAWGLITIADFSPALERPLYLYAFILPMISLQVPSALFQINFNAKYLAVFGVVRALTNGIFLIALVFLGMGITGYVLSLLAAEMVMMGLILIFSRRFGAVQWKIEMDILKKILKSSISIALTGIFVAIINRADFIMLERMAGLHQVGLYSAVYRFTNLLESIPLAMMVTLYPVMSQYAKADPARLKGLYKKCLLLFFAIAIPIGISTTFFAEPLIRIFFGGEFLEAAAGLRVLVWGTVCVYLFLTGVNLLISLGQEKKNLFILAGAGILNITLNFFWIPKYGFVGAAAATVLSYALILICTLASVQYSLNTLLVGRKR